MENWFNDGLIKWPKEDGERVTRRLIEEDGFISKKEYEAYKFVDELIKEHIFELGIPSEMFERVKFASDVIPQKKEAKLKFYQMLGLTYALEKALTSSKEELSQFERDFGMQLLAKSTPDDLKKARDAYDQYTNSLYKELASLLNDAEEKRQKH